MQDREKNSNILFMLNPLVKIIILISVSIIVSLEKKFYLSITLLLLLYIILVITRYEDNLFKFISKSKYIFLISFSYVFFIVIINMIFQQSFDLEYIVAVGFRFLIFGSYSLVFIDTVKPRDLVLVLIKYFKFSEKLGFAFLASYRFFPNFKNQLEKIRFSHITRGITKSGFLSEVINFKNYMIPLLVTSIRSGIKISISMESRAFGKYKNRTYYNNLSFTKTDIIFTTCFFFVLSILITVLIKLNLSKFSLFF